MKVLSLKQSWLWAITDLGKRIENRSWNPPEWLIGKRIALHASKKDDPDSAQAIYEISGTRPPTDLPRGAIVATCRVIGWINEQGFGILPSPCMGHFVDDPWFFGPIGWILEDVKKLERPIPVNGTLGLWDWEPRIER